MGRMMKPMRCTTVMSLAALLVLTSCAATSDARLSREELYELHMKPFEDLKAQKAELWELGFTPEEFEFEGAGKVTVSNWQLTGWPGEVHVNARILYENTTEAPVQHAVVWLEILDSEGRVAGSTGVRLMNPLGYPVWPGGMVALTVRAPTNDAHLDPKGWQWGVACSAHEDPDPGDKPVLVVTEDLVDKGRAPGTERGDWRRLPNRPQTQFRGSYYTRPGPLLTPGVPYWER